MKAGSSALRLWLCLSAPWVLAVVGIVLILGDLAPPSLATLPFVLGPSAILGPLFWLVTWIASGTFR